MAANTQQVLFKLGSQANLNPLLTSTPASQSGAAIPGAFYVTNDSHRLYFGIVDPANTANTKAVSLNQGVISVKSIDDLPTITTANRENTAGQFYYVTDDNILCVYNGEKWVHINPNTNTKISTYTVATAQGTTNTNSGVVESTIKDTDNTVKTHSWTLIGGKHIQVTAGTKALTIACDVVYSLMLGSATGGGAEIKLIEGDNVDSGKFTITGANGIAVNVADDNISIDGTAIKTAAENQAISAVDMAFDGNGALKTTITQKGGNSKSDSVTPKITLGNNTTQYTFKNGVANLPVYTKDETDEKLRGIDAVRYKGVVTEDASSKLPTEKVSKGDAWKIGVDNIPYKSADGTILTNTKVGDLLIANGTEGTDGYITSSTLYWDYIPSGDDIEDTLYEGAAVQGADESAAHGLQLVTKQGKSQAAQLTIQRDNQWIEVNSSNSTGISNNVTIKHSEPGALSKPTATKDTDQAAVASKTITFVSGITTDAARHITGYTLTTSKFTDTNSAVSANEVALTQAANNTASVTVSNTVKTTSAAGDTTSKTSNYSLISENSNLHLQANATTNEITFGLVWGSF